MRPGTSLPASLLLFFGLTAIALSINAGGITTNANWCQFSSNIATPIIAAGVGCLIALYRRLFTKYADGGARLLRTIVDDFKFQSFATISILSIVYAVTQGTCFGAAVGFLIQAIQTSSCNTGFFFIARESIALSGVSILVLLLSRLVIESYALIYRVASDISAYTRNHNANDDYRKSN